MGRFVGKDEMPPKDRGKNQSIGACKMNASSCTLHDASIVLIQSEVNDLKALEQASAILRAVLNPGGAGADYPDFIKQPLEEAMHLLNEITAGASKNSSRILDEIYKRIENAASLIEVQEFKLSVKKAGLETASTNQTPSPIDTDGSRLIDESGEKTPKKKPRLPEPIISLSANDKSLSDSYTNVPLKESFPENSDTGLLTEYVNECCEYLEQAEASLLTLESDPWNQESINLLFRILHTMKGTSAFLGMRRPHELAHCIEGILSRMRTGEIGCTRDYADLILRSIDMLNELIANVQNGLSDNILRIPAGYAALMRDLMDPNPNVISPGAKAPSGTALTSAIASSLPLQKISEHVVGSMDSTVRVQTNRLNRLIDMLGELVIAHSMISQDELILTNNNHELIKKVDHTAKIVRDLQDLGMSMRMVPFRGTFQRLLRVSRDVSQKCGKKIAFITRGEETEIDRNMVDVINDPLVHMVRNAVDHGIEMPEARRKTGKEEVGTISLSAHRAGDNVVIELRDDGKGLSRDKIVQKALEMGLIESDLGMTDIEVYKFILEPGFSTAEEITDVSGRGVGMDVVRRNIERLKGRIDISSIQGEGTVITIRLPLTLAITDGMLVGIGRERYIIPITNIILNLRPESDSLSTVVKRGEMICIQDRMIPICRLYELLNIEGAVVDPTKGILIILSDGEQEIALLVDEILGQRQLVVKSLDGSMAKASTFSGFTILGDGCVGLILDPEGIIAAAKEASNRTPTISRDIKAACG
ncbi:MAG: chemotaxis protein CheA [Candidatus Eisenbacteria bacterium]|nr:chemotaxis protein CheA [Candidatus Eisenbacteria bacterium]